MDVRRLLPLLWLTLAPPALAGVSERAYDRAVELIDRLYLYPEQVHEAELLHGGARGLAEAVDWLVVEPDGHAVHLRHGNGTPVGSVSVASMDTLAEGLLALESLVRDAGYPIRDDIDLRIEILEGMTRGLDRYSRVLAGERLARFDVRLKGTLVGIGATLSSSGDRLEVTHLVDGGPGQTGGLMVGDVVLRIDGASTVNMPVREAVRRIRGAESTPVSLTVRRGDDELDLPLVRAEVVVPNVEHRVLPGQIGYVRIDHFSQRTVQNLVSALRDLRSLGALDKGLVLDLRGNTGGSMKESARAADHFVTQGMLLRTAGPDGGQVQNLQARMDAIDAGTEPEVAVAVLMDDRTASGSEILAGALLELDRAVLVGGRSYGKGTVQKIYNLDDDARLKLTVAQYLLENDRSIADAGLLPDVALGDVTLDAYGVRYRGWDVTRAGIPWEDVLPVVDERPGWRGEEHPTDDVVLEVARRAVLRAEGPARQQVLDALDAVVPEIRAVQDAHLVAALEARGIDWSPAPGTEVVVPETVVTLHTRRDPLRPDAVVVEARVVNEGQAPLHRVLVELSCESFSPWDGVVVPVGRVDPGATASGEVAVALRPGVLPREDEIDLRLRADHAAPVRVDPVVLAASSSPRPSFGIAARLVGEGDERRAEVTVQNLSDVSVAGLEVSFAFPGDLGVELTDHASRVPLLLGRDAETLSLGVTVGPDAPPVIPLELHLEGERFGSLLDWPVGLPLDGSPVEVAAPRVRAGTYPLSTPIGPVTMPFVVDDERALDHVVVYANGEKIGWAGGGTNRIEFAAEIDVQPGTNHVVVVARDDQGLETQEVFVLRGEQSVAADAAPEP